MILLNGFPGLWAGGNVENYALNPLTIVVFITSVFALYLTCLTLNRSKRRVDYYLTFYFFTLCIISTAYMFQLAAQTLELKIFWANIKVIGICLMPGAWLMVSFLVTLRRLPPQSIQWLVWLGAGINIFIAYTDPLHRLFRKSVVLLPVSETLGLMKSQFGDWYLTGYLSYIYGLTLISLVCYVNAIVVSATLRKVQYLFHAAAIIIGAVGAVPFILGKVHLDTYILTIIFTALIHYFLIYRFGFLDVIQLAKEVVVDKIDSGIFIFAPDGKLVEKNARADEILPQVPGVDGFCRHFKLDCVQSNYGRQMIRNIEIDGRTRRLAVTLRALAEPDREVTGYLAEVSDVTEQMQQMQLKSEKEKLEQKRKIIGDIHDGIGGAVSILSLLAGQENQSESELRNRMDRIQSIARETSREIRLMMNAYDRENPDFEELSGDMRYVGNLFTGGTGICFSLEDKKRVNGPLNISFPVYIDLIRFFKECIVNIVKHSGADRAVAMLETDGRLLTVCVRDNGLGYESGQTRGIGVKNMEQRIESMGGALYIDNEKGTSIKMTLPLHHNGNGEIHVQ